LIFARLGLSRRYQRTADLIKICYHGVTSADLNECGAAIIVIAARMPSRKSTLLIRYRLPLRCGNSAGLVQCRRVRGGSADGLRRPRQRGPQFC